MSGGRQAVWRTPADGSSCAHSSTVTDDPPALAAHAVADHLRGRRAERLLRTADPIDNVPVFALSMASAS